MLATAEPKAIAAVPHADQAEADVVALQSIDLRILLYFADQAADDCWRTCDEAASGLRVTRQAIAWRPLGRLQALELIELSDRIPLTGGRRFFRATPRGRAAAKLVRNPSAASAVTREWLQFLNIPTQLEPVA